MKSIAIALCAYGTFLILAGVVGYLSNPEKAQTALFSGGTFGALHIGLGWLMHRGWKPTRRVALGSTALLGGVFIWRTTVTWMAYADGRPEKLVAAVIISSMLAASCLMFVLLFRSDA